MVRSNEAFTPGSRTFVTVRPDRLVLFEPASGKALAVLSPERSWICV